MTVAMRGNPRFSRRETTGRRMLATTHARITGTTMSLMK